MDRRRGARFTQHDALIILSTVVGVYLLVMAIMTFSIFMVMMNGHARVNESFSNNAVCIANDFNYFAQKFEPVCAHTVNGGVKYNNKKTPVPEKMVSKPSTTETQRGWGAFIGDIIIFNIITKLVDIVWIRVYRFFRAQRAPKIDGQPLGPRPSIPINDVPAPENCCAICQELPKDAVYMPCRHLSTCQWCAHDHMKTSSCCPVCRAHVENIIRVYT